MFRPRPAGPSTPSALECRPYGRVVPSLLTPTVTPAKAGAHPDSLDTRHNASGWIPAFAGMTAENLMPQSHLPTYPPAPTPCDPFPHPLHRSEIMTSGWCGGGWVARESFRARPKVPRHGPVRWPSRCNARDARCGAFQGGKAAHIRGRERWRCGWIPGRRPPTLFAMRHGMLPGRGTIRAKPRSAGEARAS